MERIEAIKEKEKLLADVLSTMAPKEAVKVSPDLLPIYIF